jgi:hypothetical protein
MSRKPKNRKVKTFGLDTPHLEWWEDQKNASNTLNLLIANYRAQVTQMPSDQQMLLEQIRHLEGEIEIQDKKVSEEGRRLRFLNFECDELRTKYREKYGNGVTKDA